MMHLRLIVPADRAAMIRRTLVDDPRVTHVVSLPGAGLSPRGDVVHCDVTREATSELLSFLEQQGLYQDGSVALSAVDAAPSDDATRTERAAPGAPDDAIVLDEVVDRAYGETQLSWSYFVFLTLATMIAAVAVITDSSILVVGAMVVGPEFGVIAAVALGLMLRRRSLIEPALRQLVLGFVIAIAVTALVALLARAVGWVTISEVTGPRPLTGFIWRPDRWSAVVAVLAGCAGVLSQTSGKSNALVGVFISVTTVPAAGDFALSLALGAGSQLGGSAAQLGINVVGMVLSGLVTLLLQRAWWRLLTRRRTGRERATSAAARR